MSTETPTPVRLLPGQSINLTTGQVSVAPANLDLPRHVEAALDANNPDALRIAFQYLSCAWTEEACHAHQVRCSGHPRTEECQWCGDQGCTRCA